MEEEFLIILGTLKDLERKSEKRRIYRNLRDSNDPFTIKSAEFIKFFGIPKNICQILIQELLPHDQQKTSLPFGTRFFATLFFYRNGFYQKSVGNYKLSSMSQSSVSRSLHYITNLIIQRKGREVRLPTSIEEQKFIKNGFLKKFGIENTSGVVGCTHIGIIKPASNDFSKPCKVLYLNKSGFNSLHVEAVCNHEMQFLTLCADFPGSHSVADIWNNSAARSFIMQHHKTMGWFLASKSYALEPWLMTPIENATSFQQEKYNSLHKSAHNVLSKAFGLLRSRFLCLSKHSTLHYTHERAGNIIKACTILHNIVLKRCPPDQADIKKIKHDVQRPSITIGIKSEYKHEAELLQSQYIKRL